MSFILVMMMIIPMFTINASAAVTLSKQLTLYLVPNTHLDTAWQHPFPQVANNTSYGIRPMFRNSTTALNSGSQYRFTTSASAHLRMLKDYYNDDNPTSADRLWTLTKSLVDKGQLDLAGGQIVEPDLNVPNGEALVRQSLYAQHFFAANFTLHGKPYTARTGMVPDVFGFCGQLPQILFKSEMKYFVTSKVNWNGQATGEGSYATCIGSTYENFRTGSRNRDSDIMNWLALDGKSTVLANFLQQDYNNTTVSTAQIQSAFNANWNTGNNFHGGPRGTGIRNALFFYGGGDFGQGMNGGTVTTNNGNSFGFHTYIANNNGSAVNVVSATVTEFFDATVATENLSTLNTTNGNFIDGEMYAEFHRGTYTTWARLKKYNRDNEILGEAAEKAATIGFYTNSISTNSQDRIEEGWYKILINQMHDVLPGSALAWQYYLSYNQEELAANLFRGVRDNALAALAHRADTNVAGKPVFVYNDLSWARDGEVTVRLQYSAATMPAGGVVVYDGATPIYPSKVARDVAKNRLAVTFMAEGVPATGYKVFDVRAEEAGERVTPLTVDEDNWAFGNDNVKFRLNPRSGYISSLQTKVGGVWREMFAQGVGTEGGELHIHRDCDTVSPAQNFHQWEVNMAELNKEPDFIIDGLPLSMDIICNTPEKVTIRVVKNWNGAEVSQEYTLFANSDRVDVHLVADWYQTKRLLKVSFPIDADNGYAAYETSFGTVLRPTNRDNAFGRVRFEVPVHKWADVTDKSGDYGVSILNDAKYGNDSLRKQMGGGKVFVRNRITVCRVPNVTNWAGNSTYPPVQPYVVDAGTHVLNYSIYPHAGKWEDSQTVNKGLELNHPMTAFEAAKGPGNGFGASESFASVDKPNVIISALKNQYDEPNNNNLIVVRVYESSGRPTSNVTVTLPGNIKAGSAKEVNMLEHDYDADHGYSGTNAYTVKALTTSGKTVTFDIGKYEVLTIQAELEASPLAALAVPQESVSLAFNSRGVTPNGSRNAAYIEGTGASTSNTGRSFPQEYWPAGNKINYQGIEFNVGPAASNNFLNGTSAANTVNVSTTGKYSKIYIVGASVNTSGGSSAAADPWLNNAVPGTFTVNYDSGAPTTKAITFNSWRTHLSGWNRTQWRDDKPYVYDSIALVSGHHHIYTGSSSEIYECESYLFVYDIDIDDTRTVTSINIPVSTNIKIAAITLAAPVAGFGKVYDSSLEEAIVEEAPTPSVPQNVRAVYTNSYNDFVITWDASTDAVKYRVYSGTTAGFTTSSGTQIAEVGGPTYTHVAPSLSAAQVLAGTTQLYYKVVAIGRANNASALSAASDPIAPREVNYCLGLTAATRVVANHEANTSSERARDAVDGSLSTKWCATRGGTTGTITASNPAWLAVDLTGTAGQTVRIDRFVVYHCGAGGEQASANTRDFNIKVSTDTTNCMTTTATSPNGTWATVVNVANNPGNASGNVTTHPVTGVNTRFVRLYVTYPEVTTWSGATRIYEFQAFGTNPGFTAVINAESTARNAKVELVNIGDLSADYVKLAASYDFYNPDNDAAPGSVTEGNTQFKWYMRLNDTSYANTADRAYYVAIPGGTNKDLMMTRSALSIATSLRCEITVYDSNGLKGATVTIDAAPPFATTYHNKPIVTLLNSNFGWVTFKEAKGGRSLVNVLTSFSPSPALAGVDSVRVFVATYDAIGKMLDVKDEVVEVTPEGIASFIPGFNVSPSTALMKVFFWDAETMAPLFEAILLD